MDGFWQAALPTVINILLPIALTALAGIGGMALDAVRRYFNNAAADRLLDRVERAASIAVHDIEQTMVPQLKRAAEDGRITPAEAKGLRLAGVIRVKKLMSNKALKELGRDVGGDLEEVIAHMLEAKVKQMRNGNGHSPGAREDETRRTSKEPKP